MSLAAWPAFLSKYTLIKVFSLSSTCSCSWNKGQPFKQFCRLAKGHKKTAAWAQKAWHILLLKFQSLILLGSLYGTQIKFSQNILFFAFPTCYEDIICPYVFWLYHFDLSRQSGSGSVLQVLKWWSEEVFCSRKLSKEVRAIYWVFIDCLHSTCPFPFII